MSHRLTTNVFPCRSGNADYKEMHKLEDITKYNASVYNVAFYKNSPNRSGTPIRPNPTLTPKTDRKISYKKKYLNDIIKEVPFVEKIYREALKFKPRDTNINLPLVRHMGKTNIAVYNDYHIRETNSGYARNTYGGYYTK